MLCFLQIHVVVMESALTFLDLSLVTVMKERVEEDVNSMMNAPSPTSVHPVIIYRYRGGRREGERRGGEGRGEKRRGIEKERGGRWREEGERGRRKEGRQRIWD